MSYLQSVLPNIPPKSVFVLGQNIVYNHFSVESTCSLVVSLVCRTSILTSRFSKLTIIAVYFTRRSNTHKVTPFQSLPRQYLTPLCQCVTTLHSALQPHFFTLLLLYATKLNYAYAILFPTLPTRNITLLCLCGTFPHYAFASQFYALPLLCLN